MEGSICFDPNWTSKHPPITLVCLLSSVLHNFLYMQQQQKNRAASLVLIIDIFMYTKDLVMDNYK